MGNNCSSTVQSVIAPTKKDEKKEDYDCSFDVTKLSEEQKCKGREYNKQMDKNNLPYLNTIGLLPAFKENKEWNIYFHFTDWSVSINAIIINNLKNQFSNALEQWLCKLKGKNGFPIEKINVKIFGFVFNEGIQIDQSFYKNFGNYPIVTNWKEDTEQCPWILKYKDKTLNNVNFYQKDFDFTKMTIIGNKNIQGVNFSPKDWKSYDHPESISYFQTKFWNGTKYNAFAQRHYLRIGGTVGNYSTGQLSKDKSHIIIHEMGHCFFLDDFYDYNGSLKGRYNWESECGTLGPNDTIMFRAKKIQPLDHLMLEHVWTKQKELVEKM